MINDIKRTIIFDYEKLASFAVPKGLEIDFVFACERQRRNTNGFVLTEGKEYA